MSGTTLRQARKARLMTQNVLARELGVTQAYVSLLETGDRPVPPTLQKKLASVLDLGPTALPLPAEPRPLTGDAVAKVLGRLGYAGFAHRRGAKALNPAQVVVGALLSPDLDSRLAEGVTWLLGRYTDLDWNWLLPCVKRNDLQNRLGFLVELAANTARVKGDSRAAETLLKWRDVLDKSRLDRDEPLSRVRMTNVERRWLSEHRPAEAKRWRVLSSLGPEAVTNATG